MGKGSAGSHHSTRPSSGLAADFSTIIVQKQAQIAHLCEQAGAEGQFAFDTEFVMEDRYEPQVCLVQAATAREIFLIDPFLELDLQPVWELVASQEIETVVHAGQEDLALCVQHTGKLPRNVFDVQIAAGLVGYEYPLSLQKLIQATLRIRIHKTKTLTDWRRRPLGEAQLRYAAEDVLYLPAIRRRIGEKLAKLGRADWAEEEFRRFEDLSLYGRVAEDKVRRLKGTAAMGGRQLAIVKALMHWREGLAEQLNRPARVVLKDHLLVEIARLGLQSAEEIRDLRGINMSDKNIRLLAQVVTEAAALPPEHWPEPAPREVEPPGEEALISLATAILRGYCVEQRLAYGLAATRKMIRDLIRLRADGRGGDPAEVEMLNGWRGQTLGRLLDEVLSGARHVKVQREGKELVINTTAANE